ncbi:LPXTG cell wall anchor domain-containing protein, partial [Siminovitchia fortis]
EKPVEKPEQPAEPEKPVEKPEQPAEPEKPVEKPEQPAEPEKPVEKPEQPAEPEKPVEKPEQPAEPEKPVEKPEQPAEPEKPVEKPEQPAESEKPVEKPEQPAKPEKPVEKPEQPAKPEKPVENPKQPSKAEKPMKKPEQEQGAKVSGKPGSKFKGETLLTSKVSEQANVKDDRKEGKPLPNVGTSIYNMMLKPENPTERQFVVKPVEELGTKVSEQPASKFKTETLPKTTNSVENEASEQTNVKSQYDEKEGKPLPNTATNFYNMMLIGAVLVLTGGGFFLYRRKQS